MEQGRKIEVPLRSNPYFEAREGSRKKTVQVNERDGQLFVGIVTDIGDVCTAAKEAYRPRCEEIALDYGLRTLFGTDQGDLLGRGFLLRPRVYDRRISGLAAYRQSHGMRTRSPRYDREVHRLRGFLRSEIGRVLNRLIEVQRPGRIVVEKLAFRNPNLSRRMNRLVTNAGRAIVEAKLADLQERFGLEVVHVHAAYSSQECACCGYVDRRNRSGERFSCLWCGRVLHADVNASRTLRSRRSRPAVGAVKQAKVAVLRALVRQHTERFEGHRGAPRDPRAKNPYFADWWSEVTLIGQAHTVSGSSCAASP
jgi:putative transposase